MSIANESAYPVPEAITPAGDIITAANCGMTKREAFAMAAMQGLLNRRVYDDETFTQAAVDAVRYADALLAALENQP